MIRFGVWARASLPAKRPISIAATLSPLHLTSKSLQRADMLSRVFHRRRRGRICIESLLKARQSHEISHPFFHHSIPIPFSAQATLPCADNDKGEHEKIAAVFPLIFYLFCFNVMRLRRIFLFHHSKRQQSTRQNSFFFGREKCVLRWFVCIL